MDGANPDPRNKFRHHNEAASSLFFFSPRLPQDPPTRDKHPRIPSTSTQDERAARAVASTQILQQKINLWGSFSWWKPGANTNLGSRGQQELDTLRLAPQARLVQGGDGVVGDGVDAGAALDQLLQLEDLSPPGCLVNRCPIGPKTYRRRGGKKEF